MEWREATDEEADNLWIVARSVMASSPAWRTDSVQVELLPTGGSNPRQGLRLTGVELPTGLDGEKRVFYLGGKLWAAKVDETGRLFIQKDAP